MKKTFHLWIFVIALPVVVVFAGCGKPPASPDAIAPRENHGGIDENIAEAEPPAAAEGLPSPPDNQASSSALQGVDTSGIPDDYVPLDLAPGGLCLTMMAPPGATVEAEGGGVIVRMEKFFQLSIRTFDQTWQDFMEAVRSKERAPSVEVVQDEPDVLILGTTTFGQGDFICCMRVTAGDKAYFCYAYRMTKPQIDVVSHCAKTLTETAENKAADARKKQAIARFEELGCEFRPSYRTLEIKGQKVTDADLALARDLPHLCHVSVNNAKVTAAGLEELYNLSQLTSLTLEGPSINDDCLAAVEPLRLQVLWLAFTKVTAAGLEHLAKQEGLTRLDIRHQVLDELALERIGRISQLRTLSLSDGGIQDAQLKPLGSLTGLEELELEEASLTDAGLVHLMPLENLTSLDLRGTQVTPAGVMRLQAQLPKCKIQFDAK